jgi:hypothetical protein
MGQALLPPRTAAAAAGVGAILGMAYTLSPLAVVSATALVLAASVAGRDLDRSERRWYLTLVVAAVGIRMAVVGVLFMMAGADRPYVTLFGDEEIFKNRGVWIRNASLGIPVSTADYLYAFDDTGQSLYLELLVLVQALTGDAPYGIHALNVAIYVTAALVLFRLARGAYGPDVALPGLGVLLFWPTWIAWSVSALKEPLFVLVAAVEVWCVLQVWQAASCRRKIVAAFGAIVGAAALEGIREGGGVVALGGALVGSVAAAISTRGRVAALVVLAVMLPGVWLVLQQPAVTDWVLATARRAAAYHAGHLMTPGHVYELLAPVYYTEPSLARGVPPDEAARFVVRAAGHFLVQPLPWEAESTALRLYFPELAAWYVLVGLTALGVVHAARANPLVTLVLAAHAAILSAIIALSSGNIGTLIRHRGLVIPYVVWFAVIGGVALLAWMTRERTSRLAGGPDGRG